ncbi:MAG: T9SS type A sorting domain-containing protein, partial [Flavobacteriales bacterium]|nr:T9SS type A sorting domain-containing protein [Flavobacteriales bacterium]
QLMEGTGGSVFLTSPDLDLSQLSGWSHWGQSGGNNIGNKAVLEFDFVPENDMVSFRYVFSSEEYERWTCSRYNDVFGWFISGPGISGPFLNNAMNIAFIPGSMAPVCINAVNSGRMDSTTANGPDWTDPYRPCFDADPNWQANSIYYRYNGGQWTSSWAVWGPQLEAPYNADPYYIQHNGMTVVLTASAAVRIGETYHMKMGIGNVGDNKYPSAVFIEQNTFRASDRFTLTVDEGPNVTHSGTGPVVHESSTDSVYLRFNRWGGFYLDEYLQIAVGGDAVAGVDYMPALPDSIHFNQLDSAVVVPLALPVRNDEPRSLDISLINRSGNKVQTFPLTIAQELSVGAAPIRRANELSVFPNPAQHTLYVTLPPGSVGQAEVQVLDMAGRVVLQRTLNGSTSASLDVSQLPTGLYTVKANAQGRVTTTRVSVRP